MIEFYILLNIVGLKYIILALYVVQSLANVAFPL
jgi:hypothetical protein